MRVAEERARGKTAARVRRIRSLLEGPLGGFAVEGPDIRRRFLWAHSGSVNPAVAIASKAPKVILVRLFMASLLHWSFCRLEDTAWHPPPLGHRAIGPSRQGCGAERLGPGRHAQPPAESRARRITKRSSEIEVEAAAAAADAVPNQGRQARSGMSQANQGAAPDLSSPSRLPGTSGWRTLPASSDNPT